MILLFVICGILWIVAFGVLLRYIIRKKTETLTTSYGTPIWSRRQYLWQSLHATERQQLMAYWSLSIGVFTVFAVGLNRPDFSDSALTGEATGGYQVYIDCRVPLNYDLNNPEVRKKLSLDGLPPETTFLQFLRHTEDEASCLNLNKVETPTVLCPINYSAEDSLHTPWISSHTGLLVDSESLIWSLMKSVGDTLYYDTSRGKATPLIIADTYPTGIFHGNAIVSERTFRELWSEESGVEVLLMRSSDPEQATEILSIALAEYGLNIQTTEERLKMFFEVTDTYLLIFLTLGAIGLLLGIFSMLIIVRKNLIANQHRTAQLLALGFTPELIRELLHRENVIVPLYAVVIGAIGSVISILANITGAGTSTMLLAFVSLIVLCVAIYFGIKIIVNKYNL